MSFVLKPELPDICILVIFCFGSVLLIKNLKKLNFEIILTCLSYLRHFCAFVKLQIKKAHQM